MIKKTALVQHVKETKHKFDFEGVEIVHRESNMYRRRMLEAMSISENIDKSVNFKNDSKNLNKFYAEVLSKINK